MMISKQSIKETENSAIELSLTVSQETLADSYKKVVDKYTKSLQIPGFRKGKAPASVLEQKFGPSMREESVFSTIDQAVQEALKEIEDKYRPLPYSQPSLLDEENLKVDIDNELTFAVTYDIMPLFELPAYTDLKIEIPKVAISKEDIDEALERLREQNAMVIDKSQPIAKDDIVTVDLVEIDAQGNEIEETKREDFIFTVGKGTSTYKIDDDVIGLKKDEDKVVEKEREEEKFNLKISVKEVKFRDVPLLDDEFAQDVNEQYKTVKDLTEGTKKKLQEDIDVKMNRVKLEKTLEKILEGVTIAVPKSMIDIELDSAWRRFVSQWGLAEDQVVQFLQMQGQSKEEIIESWRKESEIGIRHQLLLEKIKEKENFSIDEESLNEEVEKQLGPEAEEQTKKYYRPIIEDDMKIGKANDFLLEKNSFIEKDKRSYKEFITS
ncbi:MAG: trigger factor [Sphaerochaetaceae bacterium]